VFTVHVFGRILTDVDRSYSTDALCDRDELVRFWDQKVRVQGQKVTGIKYACNSTLYVATHST